MTSIWASRPGVQNEVKPANPYAATNAYLRLTVPLCLGRLLHSMGGTPLKTTSIIMAIALGLATTVGAQEGQAPTVTDAPPAQSETPATGYVTQGDQFAVRQVPGCRKINKGGPIAGIVVASVFWWVLPMSIPVWITQAKKLKRRKAEIYEQQQRGCP